MPLVMPGAGLCRHTPGDVPLDGLNGLFQRIQVAGPEGYHQAQACPAIVSTPPILFSGVSRRQVQALQIQAATIGPALPTASQYRGPAR